MADRALDGILLNRAFRATGEHLDWPGYVEVLVVGGAALAATGSLPPGRTTLDCDVMDYEPAAAEKAVERAARVAGQDTGLPDNWLNSHVQWHRDSLPAGWRERRHFVGTYGMLRVFMADRLDLIVMKLVAGRPRDLQDVEALLRAEDVALVRDCLTQLGKKSSCSEQVPEAFERLDALEPRR